MKVVILFYSESGITKAAAKSMGATFEKLGHECTVHSMLTADPTVVDSCDLVCFGCWTAGMFVLFQRPKKPYFKFIKKINMLTGKKVVVFCTYKIATGKMLEKMKKPLLDKGAIIAGEFKFKRPEVNQTFYDWVVGLH